MTRLRWIVPLLLFAVLLTLSGCVVLCGQRVSWFYDQPADELRFLIHYDGIHDSGSDQSGKGADQIPQFISDGNIMLVDWIGNFQLSDWRMKINDPQAEPFDKSLGEIAAMVKTAPLGFYREPDGRIGAAQLVTIPSAQNFIRQLNRLINQEVLANPGDPQYPRTWEAMRAAANKDHAWIALDGQSFRIVIPASADEWPGIKAWFLTELTAQIAKEEAGSVTDGDRGARMLRQAAASIPVSYTELRDGVVFVLGRPDAPSTLRLPIRDQYQPNLESVVTQTLVTDWDRAVAADPPAREVLALRSWGPPEQQVSALLTAAGGTDAQLRASAITRLKEWGAAWNKQHSFLPAPPPSDDEKAYLATWQIWHGKMKRYPLEP